MASLPEYLRQSDLLEQLVLDRATMDTFGRVEVIWEYPKVHKVLGFICKPSRFDRRKLAFNFDQVQSIGSSGILVSAAPMETDSDRVSKLESLVNCEVWTDEGNRRGRITDYMFHTQSGAIRYYLVSRLGIKGIPSTLYALYPSQILNVGRNRVLVSEGIANGLEVIQVGLQTKLVQEVSQVREVLQDENGQLSQGLQSLVRRAANKAQRVADRAQDLTEKARDRVQALGDELLESDFNRPTRRDYDDYDRSNDRRYAKEDFDFDEPWEDDGWEETPQEKPRHGANHQPERPRFDPQPKRSLRSEQAPPSETPQRSRQDDPWDDDVW
ncbi:MAG: hypothetical protein HC860_23395 [Alkalinema sp. RU_4_3]|nr:hypothetical protein [Alkalinema sp. RU_4_3]